MKAMEREILGRLLDAYERSRIFTNEQRSNRRVQLAVAKAFPKYADDAEYEYFCEVNEAAAALQDRGLVLTEQLHGGILKRVILCQERVEEAYSVLGRRPRASVQRELEEILKQYADAGDALGSYAREQIERIRKNRNVEYFDGDAQEYRGLLILVRALLDHEDECFVRDFSARVLHDSKKAEELRGRAEGLLYEYGDYSEKGGIYEEHGVLRTPAYVMVKGAARIRIAGQALDLSRLSGDIAFSTQSLADVEEISLLGDTVMTVENLTSFHDISVEGGLVVYLGGFHNRVKRDFLRKLHERNPQATYLHFGDIDAGGFYILDHLRSSTGIDFGPYRMDADTLRRYAGSAKPLTSNDRARLLRLLAETDEEERREVIELMLAEGIKLEQEAVYASTD